MLRATAYWLSMLLYVGSGSEKCGSQLAPAQVPGEGGIQVS